MRLLGTAAGIAIGVALLLLIIGSFTGLQNRTERATAFDIGLSDQVTPISEQPLSDDEVMIASNLDLFGEQFITHVHLAATPNSIVAIPGIPKAPPAGEFYASPELAKLVASAPADQLGDRYGTLIGTIDSAGLPSPDSLVAISGETPETMDAIAALAQAQRLHELRGERAPNPVYAMVAIVGALAVLFPVVIFIGIATRLGQAARSERFASLRLMGATPRRVAQISALETGAAALVGAVLGLVLWRLAIPVAALISIEGGRFFTTDLNVNPAIVILIVLGVAVLATGVAYFATLRADIGPLGGSREQPERPPQVASVWLIVAGIAMMFATPLWQRLGRNLPFGGYELVFGFPVIAIGLIMIGPWLTAKLSGWAAKRARAASGVIALNRIKQHPRSVFRSVSGLVIAVFVVTVFSVAITTETDDEFVVAPASGRLPLSALSAQFDYNDTDAERAAKLAAVRDVPGVTLVTTLLYIEDDHVNGLALPAADAAALGLTVPPNTNWAVIPDHYFTNWESTQPVEPMPIADAAATGPLAHPRSVIVDTDGTLAAIERARTAIEGAWYQPYSPPATRADLALTGSLDFASQYAGLANTGIVLATIISAISLAVATIAGVLDRRRVLGLLRLTGMPPRTLSSALTLETAVPLVSTFALCIGLGALTAWALVSGLSGGRRTVTWPAPSFYWTIALSLALAAVAVLATFRTARKNTEIEHTRFE